MKQNYLILLVKMELIALLCAPALAFAGPSYLGTAQNFAVLGGSTVTCTGASTITGDLGVSPGSAVVGFPVPCTDTGTIHAADAVVLAAQNDLTTAYNTLESQVCNLDLTGQDLGTVGTLTPGVYCFSSSAQLTGTLTLDALGNPNSVFIFKMGSTLTTASNASVNVINGGSDCGVSWQVGSSATLGTSTALKGNIVALTSITLNTGASLSGRALARNGAVTLDTNAVSSAVCADFSASGVPGCDGVAGSEKVVDSCGVCGGDGTSCNGGISGLPGCDGINGSGKVVDRCGVCAGDGSSCLGCETVNIQSINIRLDSNALQQSQAAKRSASTLKKIDSSDSAFANNAIRQADTLYAENWEIAASNPSTVSSCTNTAFCAQVDITSTLDAYDQNAKDLYNLGRSVITHLKRRGFRGAKLAQYERLTKSAYKQSKAASESYPKTASQCS